MIPASRQRGATILELMLVLMLALVAVGTTGAFYARTSHEADVRENLGHLFRIHHSLRAARLHTDYTGLNANVYDSLVPPDMRTDTAGVYRFKGGIGLSILPSGAEAFVMTLNGQGTRSLKDCQTYVLAMWPMVYNVRVGTTTLKTVQDAEVNGNLVSAACAGMAGTAIPAIALRSH